MRTGKLITGLLVGVAIVGAAHATTPFYVSYEPEKPGVTKSTTTATFSVVGVEDFEKISNLVQGKDVSTSLPLSYSQNFTTDFGTGGKITGNYSNVQINPADQYGGAGGTGQYPVAFGSNPYTLTLSSVKGVSANYFGYWLSALDRGNTLTFVEKGKSVYTFSASDALKVVNAAPNSKDYFGNPDYHYDNKGEPYVFLNFFDKSGSFDKIVFSEQPAVGGYESDNHTVGYHVISYGKGVGVAGSIPEPASWALVIIGAGGVGAALRRRRASVVLKAV